MGVAGVTPLRAIYSELRRLAVTVNLCTTRFLKQIRTDRSDAMRRQEETTAIGNAYAPSKKGLTRKNGHAVQKADYVT